MKVKIINVFSGQIAIFPIKSLNSSMKMVSVSLFFLDGGGAVYDKYQNITILIANSHWQAFEGSKFQAIGV